MTTTRTAAVATTGQGNFQDFFNRFFGQGPDGGDDGDQGGGGGVRESLGSGFIVDSKGYIITNNHVVDKADKIYVKLSTDPDNQDFGRPARVIGTDKATDLAVIKIESSTPLPTVKLGNSDSTSVGDWVEAIGSPFTLSQTVTAGIISAKNRTIEPGVAGQFQHFIQTDAAINPGNSGGPLLNMNGEVIGVNTAIFTQSAGYQGIGFAMPSNTVADIYNDLISPGHKVVRGSIGIQFRQGLSGAVNRVYGFKNGVLVQQVQPNGPADKGGIKPGDIITTLDGRSIKDGDDLVNEIASRRPGSTIRLGFLRDGKPQDATVTIGDRDKVFADLGPAAVQRRARQQRPARRGQAGHRGSRCIAADYGQDPPVRRGHRLGALRIVCRSLRPGAGPGDHPRQQAAHVQQGPVRCRGQQAQVRRRRGSGSHRSAPSQRRDQLYRRYFAVEFGSFRGAVSRSRPGTGALQDGNFPKPGKGTLSGFACVAPCTMGYTQRDDPYNLLMEGIRRAFK